MEPVTHVLTGACLARAGFNRRAAYATLTMAIAAEMPDIDTLWSLRGPVEGFAHHRGITHTFVGLPFEAAALVGAVYLLHRWRVARAKRVRIGQKFSAKPLTKAPVRWWALYGCALVALLSHLLLDYTNNYGLRPFYPFNTHWYAASIVFIFDPVMFGLLLVALAVPSLFGLVSAEVGAKRPVFRGRGWAIAALLCVLGWWTLRYMERQRAVEIAMLQSYEQQQAPVAMPVPSPSAPAPESSPDASGREAGTQTAADGAMGERTAAVVSVPPAQQQSELVQPPPVLLTVQRVEASPEPVNPFHWAVVMDFGPLYQLATIEARSGTVLMSEVTYPKPPSDAAIRAAEASALGRAYLDWSAMPVITEDEPTVGGAASSTRKVTFRDPRFMGSVSWLERSGRTPLTAEVKVNAAGRVVEETMDGRVETRRPILMPDVSRFRWSDFGLSRK
ncbi:metal-dependent hydrolase [Granulicella sp. 5B5]|uniref:metal-dependent hydrolase n=1 Tax=Granulicella sp. 5B5 TaxID=1617967 RepID=UPI0015F55BD9|nr:metal-dependent hydrolase [Granulicella sp. 5B5]QMV19359.1 metal-dependent hydrolase [Granulicella sp. 5B5]